MLDTYPHADALAEAVATAITARLAEALRERGRASLVGTGGRSPGAVYDRLRAADLDWTRIAVTLSDDRCVPPDDADSNQKLLRDRLLQGAAARAPVVSLWPRPDPAALAALQPFDAVMLGMGEDGHIASLIPGDPGLEDALTTSDLLRDVPAGLGRPPLPRVTLTLSAVLNARAIFLLIAGAAKREVIRRAQAGEDLPVGRLISQSKAPVRIFWEPGV